MSVGGGRKKEKEKEGCVCVWIEMTNLQPCNEQKYFEEQEEGA